MLEEETGHPLKAHVLLRVSNYQQNLGVAGQAERSKKAYIFWQQIWHVEVEHSSASLM